MIPKIKSLTTIKDYKLDIIFDDGKHIIYDVADDMAKLPNYDMLKKIPMLFENRHSLIPAVLVYIGMMKLICPVIRFMNTVLQFNSVAYRAPFSRAGLLNFPFFRKNDNKF